MPIWENRRESDRLRKRSLPVGVSLEDYADLGPVLEQGDHIETLEIEENALAACADCGRYAGRYVGPIDFDGRRHEHGDYVCHSCADSRGVEGIP